MLSRVLVPVENAICCCIGIDKAEDMGWKRYLASALVFSAVCLVGLFALCCCKECCP